MALNSKYWSSFQVPLERLRQQTIQSSIQSIDKKIASAQDQGNVAFIQNWNQQNQELVADEIGQRKYAKMISQIGSGIVENTDQIYITYCKLSKSNWILLQFIFCRMTIAVDTRMDEQGIS